MWFIFGWGYRSVRDHGAVMYQQCPRCNNQTWFRLLTVRRWFTLFFIPIVPYRSMHTLLCSVCNHGMDVAGSDLARAKRMNQLAVQYTSGAITGQEYRHLLPNVSGVAEPAAVDPPRDVPVFRGTSGRRATVMRIGIGLAALAGAIVLFATTHTGAATTSASSNDFMVGSCVSGAQTSLSISPASCVGTHDARIDTVLTDASQACPSTDVEFVPDSRRLPTLCLDYSDHNP